MAAAHGATAQIADRPFSLSLPPQETARFGYSLTARL